LLQVENLFLRTKAVMRTRPIFHSSDAAIRDHVFCSFLALAMQKCLEVVAPGWHCAGMQDASARSRSPATGAHPPSNDWLVRTDVSKPIADLLRHAHIALPPRAKQMAPPKLAPPTKSARKRHGRPTRGATPSRISPKAA
jgi:hypothetical protein